MEQVESLLMQLDLKLLACGKDIRCADRFVSVRHTVSTTLALALAHVCVAMRGALGVGSRA